MTEPLLSIIMPVYGVEEYISKAIQSVLSQTFQDWELIVVNDGSLDRSPEIARKFAETDNRIQVFDKSNGGLSDARNYGLSKSKGKYIHFFDSDDWITSDFYMTLLSKIIETDCDILITGYIVDNLFNEQIKRIENRDCFNAIYTNDLEEDDINVLGGYINYAWNKIFKTAFLKFHNLTFKTDLYRIEDAEFMSRVLSYNPKWMFVSFAGYHYVNRNRETLGTKLDDKTAEFSRMSLDIANTTLTHLQINENLKIKYINNMSLDIFKAIFGNLYKNKYYNFSRIKYVKSIIYSQYLETLLNGKYYQSFSDRILAACIRNKFVYTIHLIYSIKYRKQ